MADINFSLVGIPTVDVGGGHNIYIGGTAIRSAVDAAGCYVGGMSVKEIYIGGLLAWQRSDYKWNDIFLYNRGAGKENWTGAQKFEYSGTGGEYSKESTYLKFGIPDGHAKATIENDAGFYYPTSKIAIPSQEANNYLYIIINLDVEGSVVYFSYGFSPGTTKRNAIYEQIRLGMESNHNVAMRFKPQQLLQNNAAYIIMYAFPDDVANSKASGAWAKVNQVYISKTLPRKLSGPIVALE